MLKKSRRGSMSAFDDAYIVAWQNGGAAGVEALLKTRCPEDDARVRELERLEAEGTWDIQWH